MRRLCLRKYSKTPMGAASHPSQASVESSAVALRTSLPTAAEQLITTQNTSTPGEETKQSPATKTEQWRGSRQHETGKEDCKPD
ncbi:uncharacterized protein LOC143747331 isoform X5 [Siphateles boraxobius]|uniref:uncharacterized protein LOC143747331 isoform X5 n=1 Tax=Siphateles boraxobius TaxID=180520 RepID=UPI00406300D9